MHRRVAEAMDQVLFRWTIWRAQLARRTQWPDPALLQALRDGSLPPPDFHDPGPPTDVELTPVGLGPDGPDYTFRFDSTPPYAADHDRSVYGTLFLPRGPVHAGVVLLPGAFTGVNGYTEANFYHYAAAGFAARGIAAALLETPLHQQRSTPGQPSGHDVLHGDLFPFARGMAQAVRDARATIGWLNAGYGPTGYWGISLGAWIAMLLAQHDPRLAFLVLLQPPATLPGSRPSALTDVWWRQLYASGVTEADIRRALAPFRRHDPPQLPPERILIQAARYDRISHAPAVHQLWLDWGQPLIRWYDQSHTSIFLIRDQILGEAHHFARHAVRTNDAHSLTTAGQPNR